LLWHKHGIIVVNYDITWQSTGNDCSKTSTRSSSLSDILTIQNTSMSIAAPNAPVNKQCVPHQIGVALPLRQDGKICTGTLTFTASNL
jgi:hypothetical protein